MCSLVFLSIFGIVSLSHQSTANVVERSDNVIGGNEGKDCQQLLSRMELMAHPYNQFMNNKNYLNAIKVSIPKIGIIGDPTDYGYIANVNAAEPTENKLILPVFDADDQPTEFNIPYFNRNSFKNIIHVPGYQGLGNIIRYQISQAQQHLPEIVYQIPNNLDFRIPDSIRNKKKPQDIFDEIEANEAEEEAKKNNLRVRNTLQKVSEKPQIDVFTPVYASFRNQKNLKNNLMRHNKNANENMNVNINTNSNGYGQI